ncbi:dystrotelin [Poecilia reticulata]|uniref:dystrotelin n=1 Tax=Poecilia reticulata TaxID=8081 RepID=UPI0004A2211B|nr:PREDICTED: dystrotelin [Poecilia reticulata]
MDPSRTEPMTEARLSVYRTAMKVRSLQRSCHMDAVFIQHIAAAFQLVGGANPRRDTMLNRESVAAVLNRMFNCAYQEVTAAASEETSSLLFRLFDREETSQVSARSLQTALVALSADSVLAKYRSLVRLSGDSSGSITRSGLSSLLQDLSKIPAAVQEQEVFGNVETAVTSCFNQGGAPAVNQSHLLSWLKSEPRLLLWLPTLYRLSASQKVSHAVRCHTCKAFPIIGLRYRCRKCVNVQVCQDCFLNGRQTRKHKTHHPVVEFCTQPTWRESLSSLVHNARHALLPRRNTHRETDRTSVLTWAEPAETQNRAPPTSNAATLLASSTHSSSTDEEEARDAAVQVSPPLSSSKSLQTDKAPPPQQGATLLTEVRNLQRDKWLLEQQVGAWRLTVQSEQGILEDRCSEMEVTMATMRQHNERLQDMLNQALRKMEAQQHANNTDDTEGGTATLISDPPTDDEEEDEMMKDGDEWSLKESQTPSPTIPLKSTLSHDEHEEETLKDNQPIGRQETPEDCQPIGQQEALKDHQPIGRQETPEDCQPIGRQETPEDGQPIGQQEALKDHQPIGRQETPEDCQPIGRQETPGDRQPIGRQETPEDRQPIGRQGEREEAGLQTNVTSLSDTEDPGTCSPEVLLQQTVDRLKTKMNGMKHRNTGESVRAELTVAAEQVGEAVSCLVDAVRTN